MLALLSAVYSAKNLNSMHGTTGTHNGTNVCKIRSHVLWYMQSPSDINCPVCTTELTRPRSLANMSLGGITLESRGVNVWVLFLSASEFY